MKAVQTNSRIAKSVLALAAGLFFALAPAARAEEPAEFPAGGEKRFLVRYDHGTANLAPWAGLTLYVSSERIRVLAGDELVHEIRPESVTSFTHELRAPFDPAKTTERVMNDTVGSCSDLLTCPILGAAGVVGAAGVGVATLFTPKELVITLNWTEKNQPQTLAMKIAWYQRDFILRALEKATGHKASERLPSPRPAPQAAPARQNETRQLAEGMSTQQPAGTAPVSSGQQFATRVTQQAPPAEPRQPIQRFELILDRSVQVGDATIGPGFYLVLLQERANGAAAVAFLDDSIRDARTSKIAAAVVVSIEKGPDDAQIQPIFADDKDTTRFLEIRLPGKILKFAL